MRSSARQRVSRRESARAGACRAMARVTAPTALAMEAVAMGMEEAAAVVVEA